MARLKRTPEEEKEARRVAAREYYHRKHGLVNERARLWHAAHPGLPRPIQTPEEKKQARHKYYEEHRDLCSAKNLLWVAANPEKFKATQRKWRVNNPEKGRASARRFRAKHLEEVRKRDRLNKAKRAEKVRAEQKAWRKAHPHYQNEWRAKRRQQDPTYGREYYARHQDQFAAARRNRRARLLGAPGTHTAEDIHRLFDLQNGNCAACGAVLVAKGRGKYHVDHILPLSRGGSHDPSNLQLLCPPCNHRKNNKTPEEWAKIQAAL